MNEDTQGRIHVDQRTYVSIGMTVIFIIGVLWIKSGLSENNNATQSLEAKMTGQFDKFDMRLKTIENQKNSWSAVDMLKWAIHLQQLNKDPKVLQVEGLKVPEPDVIK